MFIFLLFKAIQDFEAEYKYVDQLTDDTLHDKETLLQEYRNIQGNLRQKYEFYNDFVNFLNNKRTINNRLESR